MSPSKQVKKVLIPSGDESSLGESVFRRLADNSSSAIVIIEFGNQNLLYANPATEVITGYNHRELTGMKILEIVHPDSRELFMVWLNTKTQESFSPNQTELKILTKNGEERWLQFSAGMLVFNQKLVMTGTGIDITERKRAEKVQEAVYKIVQAADQADSLDALLPVLHTIVGEVMIARNFYIALYDEESQIISFPYFVDEFDVPFPPQKLGKGLTEYVLITGKTLLVDMPMQEELWKTGDVVLIGESSPIWLGVPLIVGEKTIGAMVVQHYSDPQAYGEREKKILEFVSSQVAVVINRKRSEDALRRSEERYHRRVDELTSLYETTRDLAMQMDLSSILNTIANRVTALLDTPGCSIYLFDPNQNILEAVVSRGAEQIVGTTLKVGEGLTGMVAQTLQPITLPDYRNWANRSEKFNALPVTSVVEVPMLYGGELVGVLSVYRFDGSDELGIREFSESDQNLLTVFAGTAASAVHNARLFEETRQHLLELEVLYQASLASTQIHSLTAVAQRVVETLDQLMHWIYVSVWVIDEYKNKPALLARHNPGLGGDQFKAELERISAMLPDLEHGIIGWVCANGKPIITGDVQSNPYYLENIPGIRSELCVPLRIGGRTIGCINVESMDANAFADHDERLLSTLAGQTAIAIENARLYQEALLSAERRSVLYQASQEIARASQDTEQVAAAVHRAAVQLMACDAFVITMADDLRQEIHGIYLIDRGTRHPNNILKFGEGISWRVITTGKALHIHDFEKSDDGIVRHVFGPGGRTRSLLAVPMRSGERVIGMISAQSYKPDVYTDDDAVLLETLGANAGVAIENARLFEDTRQRAMRQAGLNSIITAATHAGTDLDALLRISLEKTLNALRLDRGAIWLLRQSHGQPRWVDRGMALENNSEFVRFIEASGVDLLETDIVEDWDKDERAIAERFRALEIQSSVIIPMLSGGQYIGGMIIATVPPRAWHSEEITFVESVAREVGAAADRARLFEETRLHMAELEGVNRVSIALRQAQKMDEMLPLLMDETMNALDAGTGGIWLHDASTDTLRQAIARGWCQDIADLEFHTQEGIVGRVFASGDIYFSREVSSDPAISENSRGRLPTGWSSLCAPILAENEAIGAVFIATPLPREFNSDNARLLVTIAEIAGNAIHRMTLHEKTEIHAAELEMRVAERTAELQAALVKAQEADRLKSEFIANVNHELRTPLTNLVLYYQMLRAQPAVRTEERMDVIGRELQRLRILIEDLLNLSRLDLGQISYRVIPRDVNDMLRVLVDDRRSLADERKLQLITHLAEKLPMVAIDENLISQAFSNLLTNALNYTPEGGRVVVRTSVRQQSGSEMVGLSVEDSGPGIDLEDLPHLFDRFFRGKVGQRSGAHGTGLGLAIVKQVVIKHHGEIEVDPGGTEARGATFTIWLPVKQSQETQ